MRYFMQRDLVMLGRSNMMADIKYFCGNFTSNDVVLVDMRRFFENITALSKI